MCWMKYYNLGSYSSFCSPLGKQVALKRVTWHVEKIHKNLYYSWGSCFLCTALVIYGVGSNLFCNNLSFLLSTCVAQKPIPASCRDLLLPQPFPSCTWVLILISFSYSPHNTSYAGFTGCRWSLWGLLLPWCLFPSFLLQGGHCLPQGCSPLPKAAAFLCLCIYISSPSDIKSFPLQSLSPKMNSLGETAKVPAWRGLWSIDEQLCSELGWTLWIILFSKEFVYISSGRFQVAYVGKKGIRD